MTKKLGAEGAAPAIISDHEFTPRDPERTYWSVCGVEGCGLYLAAHQKSAVPNEPTAKRAVPETPDEVRTEQPTLADEPVMDTEAFKGNGSLPPHTMFDPDGKL